MREPFHLELQFAKVSMLVLRDEKVIKPILYNEYEPAHDKTNKRACVPSEESDQNGHPPSLIRAFAVCSMDS